MTTRTWNGSTDSYLNGADWSPSGVPQAGDTAVINSGMPIVDSTTLAGVTLQLNGSSSGAPGIRFSNASLAANSTLAGTSTASLLDPPVTIDMLGQTENDGIATFTGQAGSRFAINVSGTTSGTAGTLINRGSFDSVNASPNWSSDLTGPVGTLQNEGMISAWDPANTVLTATVNTNLTGGGVMQINPHSQVGLGQAVASTQLVDFTGGSSAGSLLEIAHPADFKGSINGFSQGDTLRLGSTPYDNFSYTGTTANTGVLHLFSQGVDVADIAFNGAYAQSDFNVTGLGSSSGAVVVTTTKQPQQIVNFTNATIHQSSTDAGVAYTGPVAGLNAQYLWAGPDSVAMSATSPNMFIKGGNGDDALAVTSGTNVLDGSVGSNFLVGSSDLNSRDTFFVDGRGGQVTWGTIVNFHQGDQATIFGFHPHLSTMPFTASDGASGFQGATIHSELNGPGTGVTASMTFTGISVATANAHFSITSGTLPGGIDYLLIQYNR